MRLFGSERILGMMDSLGLDEDTPIDAKILSAPSKTRRRPSRAATIRPGKASSNTTTS